MRKLFVNNLKPSDSETLIVEEVITFDLPNIFALLINMVTNYKVIDTSILLNKFVDNSHSSWWNNQTFVKKFSDSLIVPVTKPLFEILSVAGILVQILQLQSKFFRQKIYRSTTRIKKFSRRNILSSKLRRPTF